MIPKLDKEDIVTVPETAQGKADREAQEWREWSEMVLVKIAILIIVISIGIALWD